MTGVQTCALPISPLPEPADEQDQEEISPDDENNAGLNGEDAEPE